MASIDEFYARYGSNYKWLATISCLCAAIGMTMATTIVNVALPYIQGEFGMTPDQVAWVSTGFLAANTGAMPAAAWCVASFGQRKTYLVALLIFVLSSIMGGQAPGPGILTIARVIQGAAAGLIQPLAMITILSVYPREQQGFGVGMYGIGIVLAPAIGPSLGGWFVDNMTWRWVFYVPLPFSILAFVLSWLLMPDREESGRIARFDFLGAALVYLAVFAALGAISNGQRLGWDHGMIQAMLLVSVLAVGGFFWWELRTPEPLVKLDMFRNPGYASGIAVAFIYGAGLYGVTYLVPLFVEQIQGMNPTNSGLLMLPAGLVLGVVFPLAGQFSDRFPAHYTLIPGLLFFSFSCFYLADLTRHSSYFVVSLGLVLGRIGLGLLMPAMTRGAVRHAPVALTNYASATVNFIRQLGGALGESLLTLLLDRRGTFHAQMLSYAGPTIVDYNGQTAANASAQQLMLNFQIIYPQAGVSPENVVPGAAHFLRRMLYPWAQTKAFQDGFLVVGVFFLLALIPAYIVGTYKGRAPP